MNCKDCNSVDSNLNECKGGGGGGQRKEGMFSNRHERAQNRPKVGIVLFAFKMEEARKKQAEEEGGERKRG